MRTIDLNEDELAELLDEKRHSAAITNMSRPAIAQALILTVTEWNRLGRPGGSLLITVQELAIAFSKFHPELDWLSRELLEQAQEETQAYLAKRKV